MAKFLNKKEQVIDLKLTSYGKHMLSEGNLKPTFYSFFDDNIIYDIAYVGLTEAQNKTHERIKNETQYLESQVLFEEVEDLQAPNLLVTESDDSEGYGVADGIYQDRKLVFKNTQTPTVLEPRKDIFRFEQMIGDAFLEGNTQNAPAWKVVALDGQIKSIQQKDNNIEHSSPLEIPQINMEMNYTLKINNAGTFELSNPDYFNDQPQVLNSLFYNNGEYVTLEQDNMVMYLEEINTILLNENFEVEVFEVTGSIESDPTIEDVLIRKDFIKDYKTLNGQNITDEYLKNMNGTYVEPTNNNVEYFFDIYKDQAINKHIACKGIEMFNKESYYIDIDFDCESEQLEMQYYDIYGPVTEPEICQ